VYEPVDPTSADEHVGAPMLALSMIFHLVMIALFGALLIATGRGTTWLRLIQARRVIVNPRDTTHTRRLQETAAIAKILNNLGSGQNPWAPGSWSFGTPKGPALTMARSISG
jgi:hypothetical protein